MTKYYSIVFGLILVIGIITRLFFLDRFPSSLNWDEISHGYNAYSLLLTGKDQWGIAWPIYNFRAYGDYPTTFNLYLTIPSIKLFGLNSFAIRLPSAIFGIIFIILIYYFSKYFLKSIPLALFCMFLATISPWTLFPSRAVFQSNFSQTLILAGLLFFYYGLKKPIHMLLSSLFFGLSMYSYHNARIAVPILVPALIIFHYKNIASTYLKSKKLIIFSLIIFLFFAVPNLINLFSPASTARNRWVGIINPASINLINESRRLFTGPKLLNVALNNKVVFFSKTVFINYLNLFNPIPIFLQGSQNFQFNPPRTGLFFVTLLPFFYLGLFSLFLPSKNKQLSPKLFLICLILLLPSAITVGDFPSIRATSAIPFYILFIAIGFNKINQNKYKLLSIAIILFCFIEFINYSNKYIAYSKEYSSAWQYGYQSAVTYIKQNYDQYSHIYITKKYGEPHQFVLFYWPWDPAKYQTDPNLKWDFHSDWYWVDGFDKFTFINDWDIPNYNFPNNSLLITSPNNYPTANTYNTHPSINFQNGSKAFDIITYD